MGMGEVNPPDGDIFLFCGFQNHGDIPSGIDRQGLAAADQQVGIGGKDGKRQLNDPKIRKRIRVDDTVGSGVRVMRRRFRILDSGCMRRWDQNRCDR